MCYPHRLNNELDAYCKCLNSSHIALAGVGMKFTVKGIDGQKQLYFDPNYKYFTSNYFLNRVQQHKPCVNLYNTWHLFNC